MSLDDFDPNEKKQNNHVYATYIPHRSPKFKTHSRLAYASSALSYGYPYHMGILYKLVDGQWVEELRTSSPTGCDICDKKFDDPYVWTLGSTIYERGVPAYSQKFECNACRKIRTGWR